MAKIQVRREIKANFPTLDVGEFGFATDTGELFIGSSIGNLEFSRKSMLGLLSELTTVDKSSLVKAINEININKGSVVTDSTTNGNIIVDGVELVVYDDSDIADVVHYHTLADLSDVDVGVKQNGFALQYESISGKFVSKALPSPESSGATSLDGLSDVDVTTVVPSENDILKYSGGLWIPSEGANGTDSLIPEDFTGEVVELIIPVTPSDVATITAINIEKTSLTLNWSPSPSTSTISHNVYQGITLLGNVPYLQRKFEVTGLSPYTDYDFKVTSLDEYGNESTGTTVTIQSGSYSLVMNGFPGVYVQLPVLTITDFVMEFKLTKSDTKQYLIDGRHPIGLGEISSTRDKENYGGGFPSVYVNDVQVTNNTKWFEGDTLTSLKWIRAPYEPIPASIYVFSAYHTGNRAVGELYDIKAYNHYNLLAHYDLRTGTFDDLSGNNNTLLHTAGRFI